MGPVISSVTGSGFNGSEVCCIPVMSAYKTDSMQLGGYHQFYNTSQNQIPDPAYAYGCVNEAWVQNFKQCTAISCNFSPIILDVDGNGFNLTSAQGGVLFDISASGTAIQVAWTSAGSDDAWLVLDRNSNGLIDSVLEMFGAATAQPQCDAPNGYLALEEFDKPENGGNGDREIDKDDSIFASLRLWRDSNHNGLSEAHELSPLGSSNITSLSLDYSKSKWRDAYRNWFQYRAKINDSRSLGVGRWSYDVLLISEANSEIVISSVSKFERDKR
jgi:hypothetical protein